MTQEITLRVSYSFTGDTCTRLPEGIFTHGFRQWASGQASKGRDEEEETTNRVRRMYYRNTNMLGGISLFRLFTNSPPVWTSRRQSYRKRIRPAGNALPQAPCGRCPWSPYRSVPAGSLPWKLTSLLGSERLETCRSHAGDTEVSEWNYRPDVSLWAEPGVCVWEWDVNYYLKPTHLIHSVIGIYRSTPKPSELERLDRFQFTLNSDTSVLIYWS